MVEWIIHRYPTELWCSSTDKSPKSHSIKDNIHIIYWLQLHHTPQVIQCTWHVICMWCDCGWCDCMWYNCMWYDLSELIVDRASNSNANIYFCMNRFLENCSSWWKLNQKIHSHLIQPHTLHFLHSFNHIHQRICIISTPFNHIHSGVDIPAWDRQSIASHLMNLMW